MLNTRGIASQGKVTTQIHHLGIVPATFPGVFGSWDGESVVEVGRAYFSLS